MIKIKLTDTEVEICYMIGTIRHLRTKSLCSEQIQSNKNPLQISIDGVLSEYAVSKHKGWHFDLNCDVRKFGADFEVGGRKFDVKSSRKIGGAMNIRYTHKDKDYDYYILVEIDAHDDCYLIGYCAHEVATHDAYTLTSQITGQPYFAIPQNQLMPIN